MTVSIFVRDLNRRHFNGELAAATIERLEALPDRQDARAFLERGASLMQQAGMPAQDFSPFQAELFASVASHLLPGCWGDGFRRSRWPVGTQGSTNWCGS